MSGSSAYREELRMRLEDAYRDLHAHPELSFAEHRTADLAAAWLTGYGYEVTQGIGGTGLTGVLRNGDGPVVLLRGDMDGLPVLESTGLPYASVARGRDDEGNDVPVMHACGHDVHVTCLLGASAVMAEDRSSWQGTLVVLFQPAEELGKGASAMVGDGLYDRVPRPDVVMGQHVAPIPAGLIGLRQGPAFASADSLRITMYGLGGHGSRPEATVDPVVMAAATVMRLQTLVSREVAGTDMAVVTVGMLRAGTKSNIIPDRAELWVNIRTFEPAVREHVLSGIRRIVEAESRASAAPRGPDIEPMESLPAVINDREAVTRTRPALEAVVGAGSVVDPGPVTGSEDVGLLAAAASAPCVFWLLGGADPAPFASARDVADIRAVMSNIPSNHSPAFAPVMQPTLGIGVEALVSAARSWLQPDQRERL